MAKNRVFISYDYDRDKASKDRLLGWDADKEFDFSSYDQSIDVAVDSDNAAAIKQDALEMLKPCLDGVSKLTDEAAGWSGKPGRRSSSRRSSWPLAPTRSTIRRSRCSVPARHGA